MAFSDDLDTLANDVHAGLSDGTITLTTAAGGGGQTVAVIRQPRSAFDAGGAGMDRGEWLVLRSALATLPLGGWKVTDNASGAAVTYIVGRDDVSLECAGREVRIRGTRMKGTGA